MIKKLDKLSDKELFGKKEIIERNLEKALLKLSGFAKNNRVFLDSEKLCRDFSFIDSNYIRYINYAERFNYELLCRQTQKEISIILNKKRNSDHYNFSEYKIRVSNYNKKYKELSDLVESNNNPYIRKKCLEIREDEPEEKLEIRFVIKNPSAEIHEFKTPKLRKALE